MSHGAGQAHRVKWFRQVRVATPDAPSPPVARIPWLLPWGVSRLCAWRITDASRMRRPISHVHHRPCGIGCPSFPRPSPLISGTHQAPSTCC